MHDEGILSVVFTELNSLILMEYVMIVIIYEVCFFFGQC